MRFAELPAASHESANKQRYEILQKLNLKEGDIEIKILISLSEVPYANVYELWKGLRDLGHYSTVLRALRRLKNKRLANILPSSTTERNTKVYTSTLLGILICTLYKGGWKAVAEFLAETSVRFRECVQAHRPFDPYYYWRMAREVTEKLLSFPKFRNIEPDLEKIVTECEKENLVAWVVEDFYDPLARTTLFQELKKLSYVGWIRSIIMPEIDGFIENEKTLLQTLVNFKRDLLTAEREAKLDQFPVKKRKRDKENDKDRSGYR